MNLAEILRRIEEVTRENENEFNDDNQHFAFCLYGKNEC